VPSIYDCRAGHYILCCYFELSFLAAKSPRSLGQSSPNFGTCSVVTRVYKIRSEVWGPLPKIFGGPKHRNFSDSETFANIPGTQQDIVKWKMALQIAITPAHMYFIQ